MDECKAKKRRRSISSDRCDQTESPQEGPVNSDVNKHLLVNGVSAQQCTSDYGSTCSRLSLESLSLEDFDEYVPKTSPGDHYGLRDTRNQRILTFKGITVVIPDQNLSGYKRDEFYIHIVEDPAYVPTVESCELISKVICVGPHGSRFGKSLPALIRIPIKRKERQCDNEVKCFYSNSESQLLPPKWEKIPPENYAIKRNFVIITAYHFSLFTVVLEPQYPSFSRQINWFGGTLTLPNFPGIELKFPGIHNQEYEAYCKVLIDKDGIWREPFSCDGRPNLNALASPIIMVGPTGMNFGSQPAVISLPIPRFSETVRKYGRRKAKITVWRSAKNEEGALIWVQLNDDLDINENHSSGEVVVSFPVYHFSFFKAVWDLLSDSVYGVKLGFSYFYPFMTFSMMCQASMEENKDNRSFALEVILYRSDKEKPETSNYPYKVGRSLKPKLVRTGSIVIKLKSELFEANVEAGEDLCLTKIEDDFRGREFEKQFVCRYKEGKRIIEKGTIGKVIVERIASRQKNELLFEFNLHKHGCESEDSKNSVVDWSTAAIRELAETLHITESDNWKKLAHQIGFTRNEIETKLKNAVDPFIAVVNLYQKRGGTPEEFLQRLNEVSRNLSGFDSVESTPPRSKRGSPTSNRSDGSNSSRSRISRVCNFETPSKWGDADNESECTSVATESTNVSSISSRKRFSSAKPRYAKGKRRKIPNQKRLYDERRRQLSEYSETVSSSESSDDNSTIDRANIRKLSDSDMWQISSLMNTMNWRALGRTLGLEESVLLNIEHAYKSTGFRECAYQMMLEWKGRRPQQCTYGNLYTALCKEKMNAVAKGIKRLPLGQNTDDYESV